MLDKIPESEAVIRFQDCDPHNHLNNSKYIDYFINAREDQILKHYHLDIFDYARKNGKSWVVGSHQIAFISPAFLMEHIRIDSQLIAFNNKTLHVEMRMWDRDKGKLKSVLWSTFVHFDFQSQKAIPHDEELNDLFHKIHLPVEEKAFQERIANLRAYSIK